MKSASLLPLLPLLGAMTLPWAGCTLAPSYTRPTAPITDTWPDPTSVPSSLDPAIPDSRVASPLPRWEEFFADPELGRLVGIALTNNRDLRLASLNVLRFRALYGISRASLLPSIDATGQGAVQNVPADLSSSGSRRTVERYDANLGVASWEIDFFGRMRSVAARAGEEYLASREARRSAEILVVSSVARAYVALAIDRENLALARRTLETQTATLRLVQRRQELGLVAELDVARVRSPLEIARREVAVYEQRVARDLNALDLLAGRPVERDPLPDGLARIDFATELHAGLPSEVLQQRPDVLQAEAQLRAANADIGAARAAFFPRVSLTSALGTASADLSGLFQAGSGAWSYAPQIVLPLFDARTWSAHRAAKVQLDMAVATYEKAVQAAFRDVADALAVRATVGREIEAQESLVVALETTLRLARTRFDDGLDDYLGVLDAERSLFAARQVLVVLRGERLDNLVQLYAALGGGASPEPSRASAGAP